MQGFRKAASAWVCFFAVVVSAAIACQLLWSQLENRLDPEYHMVFIKRRWFDFEKKLRGLPLEGKIVVVYFGLSEIELGIDPAKITALSGRTDAIGLNVGFRSLPVDSIPVLFERLFRELHQRKPKEILLVMKAPIFSFTRESVQYNNGTDTSDFTRAVADFGSFRLLAAGGWRNSIDLLLKKALLGSSTSSALNYWLYRNFLSAPGRIEAPGRGAINSPEILQEGHWPLARLGKTPWELAMQSHPEFLANAEREKGTPASDAWFQNRFGILSPTLDEAAFSRFLESARWAQHYGVRTVLFDFPDWYEVTGRRSASTKNTLRMIGENVRNHFQASYLDLSSEEAFLPEDFLDSVHLGTSGQEKAWRALAKQLRTIRDPSTF